METKVILNNVRFSYAHVFKAVAIEEGQTPKFSVSIIIPKSEKAQIDKIKKAIQNALEAGKAKLGGKIPANYKNPLRDGDTERPDDEAYEDAYFINANSTRRPGVVDANLEAIIDEDEFYSGCYGRASVNFYAFNTSGNKGVAAGLQNLQKLKDGDRLAGGSSAAEDFGDANSDDLM